MSGARRFRYRLDALARLRTAERDAIRADADKAMRNVERMEDEHKALARSVEAAEGELRALCSAGAELSLDAHSRLQRYLERQRQLHRRKRTELDAAARALFRLLADAQAKAQEVKALDKHRARRQQEFDVQQVRASFNAADDLWPRKARS